MNPTMWDVVAAANNMGVTYNNAVSLSNFLILNEDEFTSDDYAAFIATMNALREEYIDDWVAEHYPDKTAGGLTEEEKREMWAWEFNGGLPMAARQAMLNEHIRVANNSRIKISQRFDSERYTIFEWTMRH